MKIKGIRKRGNIYWIRYAGQDGTIIEESTKSHSQKVANDLLTIRRAAVLSGIKPEVVPHKKVSFKNFSSEYLDFQSKRQKSYDKTKNIVAQLVRDFGCLSLDDFKVKLLENWQAVRIKNRGNTQSTVNRMFAVLKHMFSKAYEWGYVNDAVLKRVKSVKHFKLNNQRLSYLETPEKCNKLIDACQPHLKPIVITALNTGMRRGEILKLKWKDVDLANGLVKLEITKGNKRREIPINDTVKKLLMGLPRSSEYVFPNSEGKAYSDVKKSFASAIKAAGIEDFRFHDLRHTFASHLVMSGVDITTVKELLGHSTLTMTMRYSHLAPSHKSRAVEILDKKLSGLITGQKLDNSEDNGNG